MEPTVTIDYSEYQNLLSDSKTLRNNIKDDEVIISRGNYYNTIQRLSIITKDQVIFELKEMIDLKQAAIDELWKKNNILESTIRVQKAHIDKPWWKKVFGLNP